MNLEELLSERLSNISSQTPRKAKILTTAAWAIRLSFLHDVDGYEKYVYQFNCLRLANLLSKLKYVITYTDSGSNKPGFDNIGYFFTSDITTNEIKEVLIICDHISACIFPHDINKVEKRALDFAEKLKTGAENHKLQNPHIYIDCFGVGLTELTDKNFSAKTFTDIFSALKSYSDEDIQCHIEHHAESH